MGDKKSIGAIDRMLKAYLEERQQGNRITEWRVSDYMALAISRDPGFVSCHITVNGQLIDSTLWEIPIRRIREWRGETFEYDIEFNPVAQMID